MCAAVPLIFLLLLYHSVQGAAALAPIQAITADAHIFWHTHRMITQSKMLFSLYVPEDEPRDTRTSLK